MRTTIAIDDRLLQEAKKRAASRGMTLGRLLEDAVRRELAHQEHCGNAPEIPVFTKGTGPRPGLDITSNRALLEALDEGTSLERLR